MMHGPLFLGRLEGARCRAGVTDFGARLLHPGFYAVAGAHEASGDTWVVLVSAETRTVRLALFNGAGPFRMPERGLRLDWTTDPRIDFLGARLWQPEEGRAAVETEAGPIYYFDDIWARPQLPRPSWFRRLLRLIL